ncbi:MAG: DNA polymerase III subunit epsilon [Coriobacteriia bacterium]|nr:DNA polymerase III subunit epsilon [Coriobacteriia bacterium]
MTAPACPPPPLSFWLVPGTDPDVAAAYAELPSRAREESFGLEEEVVFVDVETTGFDPARDHLVEVAAVLARGPDLLDRFATLVDAGVSVPPETTALTGIDDAAVAGAPSPEAAVTRLLEFVSGRPVVAHNAGFDDAFVAAVAGPALAGRWVDSLPLARVALPRMRSHRLRDLAEAFALAPAPHRAPEDAASLAALWRVLLCGLTLLPREVLRAIEDLAPSATAGGWPLARVVSQVAGSLPGRPSPLDLRALRAERTRRSGAEDLPDADEVPLRCPAPADVLAEFGAEGLVGAMYAGFEPRGEQARMAEAVLGAFGEGRHLAVEAGTGVGKSVAYLVPAARFALDNGVAVGVATKTNSLLDQLVHGELPALAGALRERGEELRFVAVKGYDNYPCLRKLEREIAAGAEDAERAAILAALLAWVAQSSSGDLDALNLHWRPDVRELVTASAAECEGKRCRFRRGGCLVHGVRREAASAHVVVTNHALLFRDLVSAIGVLPPVRHWVVDEAHAAEDEARGQLSLRASHAELAGLLLALGGSGRGGLLDGVAKGLGALPGDPAAAREGVSRCAEAVGLARTLTASFFDFVGDLAPPRGEYDRAEARVTAEMRESGPWGTAAGVGRSLARRLGEVLERGRVLVTALEEADDESLRESRADLTGALSRVAEQRDALAAVLDGSDDAYVYSLTADRRRGTGEGAAAALLDVGGALAEQFYPRTRSVVFTSATIATGGDGLGTGFPGVDEASGAVTGRAAFANFAARVGLDRLPDEAWDALRLRSSYDFERQMAVFVPEDLPEPVPHGAPGHAEYLRRLTELLERLHLAMGGSTLTLFTNRREMEAAHRLVADRLHREGLRLLLQGRGVSRKRLRDEFLADETVSLFATRSFWEGFDAPGDTLRCVIVPRLPFGQLGDPLLEERRERERDWWEKWYLPQAILELKQAAGRLIRSSTDTGCLVLADARLVGAKPYARRFLGALPVRDVERLTAEDVVAQVERRFARPREAASRSPECG